MFGWSAKLSCEVIMWWFAVVVWVWEGQGEYEVQDIL